MDRLERKIVNFSHRAFEKISIQLNNTTFTQKKLQPTSFLEAIMSANTHPGVGPNAEASMRDITISIINGDRTTNLLDFVLEQVNMRLVLFKPDCGKCVPFISEHLNHPWTSSKATILLLSVKTVSASAVREYFEKTHNKTLEDLPKNVLVGFTNSETRGFSKQTSVPYVHSFFKYDKDAPHITHGPSYMPPEVPLLSVKIAPLAKHKQINTGPDPELTKEFLKYEKTEVLLNNDHRRWVLFPIRYQDLYEQYKTHEALIWKADEIDLEQDASDFPDLDPGTAQFIKHVLAFFAASDGIVMENIHNNFADEVKIPEARAFYGLQSYIESVHSETYSRLLDTYLKNDDAEKIKLFNAVQNLPGVREKAKFAQTYMNGKISFTERLVAFAAVEGILFSGSFCAIYYIKRKGCLPGLVTSNEYIARDEGLHTKFACALYKLLAHKLPHNHLYRIIESAVLAETKFINEALPHDLPGLTKDSMANYIRWVADILLQMLDPTIKPYFGARNPFAWMEPISLSGKTNFFEHRPTDYVNNAPTTLSFAPPTPNSASSLQLTEDF